MIIGLTGGMGCGKSTAARVFEDEGFVRVDSDALVRERILAEPEVVAAAVRIAGAQVCGADGHIQRAGLAACVFGDAEKLAAWEEVVHPRLLSLWETALAQAGGRDVVIEVPLLHEKRLEKWFDFVVCVASTSARQFARLSERGLNQALAEQRISKQLPLAQKMERSDFVLSNDGSLQFLRDQVAHVVAHLGAARR